MSSSIELSFSETVTNVTGTYQIYSIYFTKGIPSGIHKFRLYDASKGFAKFANKLSFFNLNNKSMKINDTTKVTSSFMGGVPMTVKGVNFNNIFTTGQVENSLTSSIHTVRVCGILAPIVSSTSNEIKFKTPEIVYTKEQASLNSNSFKINLLDSNYSNMFDFTSTDTSSSISNVLDDKIDSSIKTTTAKSRISLKIKDAYAALGFRIRLYSVKIRPGLTSGPTDFIDGEIKGIIDATTTASIYQIDNNFDAQWEVMDIIDADRAKNYLEIQFFVNKANVEIAELKYIGLVVNIGTISNSIDCDLDVSFPNDTSTLIQTQVKKVTYNFNSFYTLSKIDDKAIPVISTGTAAGGSTVVFKFNSLKTLLTAAGAAFTKENFSVSLYGNQATVVSVDDVNETLTITTPEKSKATFEEKKPLVISHSSIGNCLIDPSSGFNYRDMWSNKNTWGGEFPPKDGETVFIQNFDIILDLPNIRLNGLFIDNGSLTIPDNMDYNISTKYLIVSGGRLQIGTEAQPFKDHKLTLTLEGTQDDPALPLFGNKVLGVYEGILDIHGKPRTPVWTQLSKTASKGDKSITLKENVDWQIGEKIVIASSDFEPDHCEERIITAVVNNSNPSSSIVSFNEPLMYHHYGLIETMTGISGVTDSIDMRAEVGLISRNIIIQGDEQSSKTEYGFHSLVTSGKKNSELTGIARMSYVQLFRGGQAFQLGTYPIHYHMLGDAKESFVRGVSIYKAFNRAITLHAVNHLRIENNILFDIKGHSLFVEDSVERFNRVTDNLIILTRKSTSLLNVDFHPASFWITHPTNYYEGNHAAGSETYGFWMEFPDRPTGLHLGLDTCPNQEPLGSFKNNVAHSNHLYGLRIFPFYHPVSKPCTPSSTPVKATFENLTVYANGERGFITEEIGLCEFIGFKGADNLISELEVSQVVHFGTGKYGDSPKIIDAVAIGSTNNPATASFKERKKYGIIMPRDDNFILDNARFYNFGSPGSAAVGTCSRCEVSDASTDSGGRTMFVNYLRFDSTVTNRIHFFTPPRDIIADIDGSLAGNPPAIYTKYPSTLPTPVNWVTKYTPHLDNSKNSCSPCTRQTNLGADGLKCTNTSKQQLRRIAFYGLDNGTQMQLNVKAVTGERITTADYDTLQTQVKLVSTSNNDFSKAPDVSIYPFRPNTDPSGWAIPFITGCKYLFTFGTENRNFNSLMSWNIKTF